MTGGDDFLSGESGHVSGIRATTKAVTADALADLVALARLQPLRLRRAAQRGPRRRVLALSLERADAPNLLARARSELTQSRHEVRFATAPAGRRGKFENLNLLLAENPPQACDWLLIVDDDVRLPPGFLDAFIFLAERFQLRLAQPAHRHRSHAAWEVTRRRALAVAHETEFVEIGPVVGLAAATFDVLLPFPELRFGWGLDVHWSAIARENSWRIGVIDATPVSHVLRPVASSYDRGDAIDEARTFLSGRPYTKAVDTRRTVTMHRSWR
ncbi:MAG: hypothetical protein M3018_03580 [Actinomycetota bacterium]|nr:hypothetical protein [Actinomycetota bacterium]